MKLLSLENVSLAYGLDALLDHVKLQIEAGERICLIGRNGAGKSSLLKIIAGTVLPDSGLVWRKPQLRLSMLMQDLPHDEMQTVYDFVATGLEEAGQLLSDYHHLLSTLNKNPSSQQLDQLQRLQHKIDVAGGWQFEQNMNTILTRLALNPDKRLSELSGGWLRRAALAKALVSSPELLLLDEPTNHLDIEAIQWLEDELLNANCGLLFVTHDRALLQRLATRIIELDRGQLTSWPGDYNNFLRRKDELLHAEAKQNADFDKKLAQEERWIRQGIKARRTRNEGRVRALEAMRKTRAQRREVQGKADFTVNTADKSGQLVIDAKDVSHFFNNQTIIQNFSVRIMRGDRIGLIGPNGVGKSTLLNILLGKLTPSKGNVSQGTNLKVAYFDQLRASLQPEKTVIENVAEGSDTIEINGKQQHIISYLSDFLFTPARARTPVKALSGGECNRLLLARLFSQPANLLVLDEPTNDLDIETLELLEELLAQFSGTLLLVSHDRSFLDHVVTSTIVFEGKARLMEYVGGYQDWIRQRKINAMDEAVKQAAQPAQRQQPKTLSKLSFKQQKELASLPEKIEQSEKAKQALEVQMASPEFYQQSAPLIAESFANLKKIEEELQQFYLRWEELENLHKQLKERD